MKYPNLPKAPQGRDITLHEVVSMDKTKAHTLLLGLYGVSKKRGVWGKEFRTLANTLYQALLRNDRVREEMRARADQASVDQVGEGWMGDEEGVK